MGGRFTEGGRDAHTGAMAEPVPPPDVLSLFWSPVCAVGSHGPEGPNAQICVSVFGAGIVPEQPRIMVVLYGGNHTHDLVLAGGTLAVTVLSEGQEGLIEPLGVRSGASGDKLAGLEFALTPSGDPYFPGGAGLVDCAVIEQFDLGDATAFLCAVRERRRLTERAPLERSAALQAQEAIVLERWAQRQAEAQARSRALQHWLA